MGCIETCGSTFGSWCKAKAMRDKSGDLELRCSPHSCVTLGMLCGSYRIWYLNLYTANLFRIPMACPLYHTYTGDLHLSKFGRTIAQLRIVKFRSSQKTYIEIIF
jgi:hypothetical protein